MPVSPAVAERLSTDVLEAFRRAELVIIAKMTANLAEGIDGPGWKDQKLSQLTAYRKQIEQLVADLRKQAKTGVETALVKAYETGGLAAVKDVMQLGTNAVEPLVGLGPVELVVKDTLESLDALGRGVVNATQHAYRSIINDASANVLLGVTTLQEEVRRSLDGFAAKGITGFTDSRGRGWSMDAYCEMAMRTNCGRAAVQGNIDTLLRNGYDLVIVSDAPKECPLCRKWEGKVLRVGSHNLMAQLGEPSPPSQESAAADYPTLEEARSDGLFHANCRHSLSLYQPGITPPMKHTEDPRGYELSQKLRYYQRAKVRERRRAAAALTPQDKAMSKRRMAAINEKLGAVKAELELS